MRMRPLLWLLAAIVAALILIRVVGSLLAPRPQWNRAGETDTIRELLKTDLREREQGIAAAVLLDTSGSMRDPVRGMGGGDRPKIEMAQQAALKLIDRFDEYAHKHPEIEVQVGIYEFSGLADQPPCRRVVALGIPDAAAARAAIGGMQPDGNTPIGDAMIMAKQDLDRSGLSRQHILVVTDGESNRGFTPDDVTRIISELPEADRASVYFVAFDVEAEIFAPVKDAGALVLAAGNEESLRRALDYILTGKILVERPEAPIPR